MGRLAPFVRASRAAAGAATALFALALVLAPTGCALIRAEVGVGLGLGADVRVPGLAHLGLGAGDFRNVGSHYYWGTSGGRVRREVTASFLVWHFEGYRGVLTAREDQAIREKQLEEWEVERLRDRISPHHACAGLLPPLTSYGLDGDGREKDPWSLEIGLMVLFVDFRLGFNPFGGLP